MKICQKCGAAVEGGKFCPRCGAPVEQEGQQQFNNNSQYQGNQGFSGQQFNNNDRQYTGNQGFDRQQFNGQQQFNGFGGQQQFNGFGGQQFGGSVRRQGGSLNIDVRSLFTPGNILFFAGIVFALVASLILLITGLGNISYVSETVKQLKIFDRGSGFDTFVFVVINFVGLLFTAGTAVYAVLMNRFKNARNNNFVGAATSVFMIILLVIFYIIRENRSWSGGYGFTLALAGIVAEHMPGMITFYVLAVIAHIAGMAIEMIGINKISFNVSGGMNNGGFNPNGMNNGGFNPNGMNNGGFNPNGMNNGSFNPNGMNNGGFNQNNTNNNGFNQNNQNNQNNSNQ